ncbi:GntR family transcriptional regulator [Arthrobacter glacialis]|uniref:GntR family transcriptional regulator n=1 Tax=Arthrobacter glacialis TaxID=1664 RepID=A0A2S3ZZV8_ARTGL|nr:GntR family transcriptional regulator [Arthrobacter glacialis]POH60100.1 GntR family transcriptional regulator [Arthrobacter glacialis]POH74758.1 GntR family transcriptional regulator [Arthrobacter glacialis]
MPMNAALDDLSRLDPAAHAHTGEWVAAVLRARIADGKLLPGSKLSELALASLLGVSRNTLREAFTVLAGEMIITRIPNRGVFVASPGREEIREIYRVRRMLEPAAVLWGPELDVDALADVVADAREALSRGSVAEMASANQRFHEELIRGTGSHGLAEIMARVLAQMRLVFHAMSGAPDFHSHYVELNADLVRLLVAGERAEAAETLRRYLDRAEAELLGHLPDSP